MLEPDELLRLVRGALQGEDLPLREKEWEGFTACLLEQGCLALLARLPRETPATTKAKSMLAAGALAARERLRACEPVFRRLEQAGIPYAVVKGPVLSVMAYGGEGRRLSGDLDLLAAPGDVRAVGAALREEGFCQGHWGEDGQPVPCTREEDIFHTSYTHQTVPFLKRTASRFFPAVNVDVNTDLFWGEHPTPCDMEAVLSHREEAVIGGVRLAKLQPAMEFIALCLHHYKDSHSLFMIAEGKMKLSLFCDLYAYPLRQREHLPPERVLAFARRLGAAPYVAWCLEATRLLFQDARLEPLAAAFREAADPDAADRIGLEPGEYKTWPLTLPERLLGADRTAVFQGILNEKDRRKIAVNRRMMK